MINIAVDGPAGAGKSYLARAIAKKLGYIYVDTGALYRAVALCMTRKGIDVSDAPSVISALDTVKVSLEYDAEGIQKVYLLDEDVSAEIRLPHISMAASTVSAIPEVRAFLLEAQRNIAKNNNVIMDGRDIGTVILPDADVKIFLTASNEARAKRRYLELQAKGVEVSFEQVLSELIERDTQDSSRDIAPCVAASDALTLDNSNYTFEESVDKIIEIINEKTGGVR